MRSLALTAVDRSAQLDDRGCRPGIGAAWALALVLPWFIAIFIRSGGSFLCEAIGDDMLAKVASGQETHGMPPGFTSLLFWVTFFPGAMLAGLAAPAVWRARSEPGCKFLLAWIVPSWIVFELVPTKLPHYVLPLYPADRDPDRRGRGRPCAVAQSLAGARHDVVVHPDGGSGPRADRAADRARSAACALSPGLSPRQP